MKCQYKGCRKEAKVYLKSAELWLCRDHLLEIRKTLKWIRDLSEKIKLSKFREINEEEAFKLFKEGASINKVKRELGINYYRARKLHNKFQLLKQYEKWY